MRGIVVALAALLILVGCSHKPSSPTTDDIADNVKHSMQTKFDTDPQFSSYHLRVDDIVVVKADGNEYRGIATVVKVGNPTPHDVPVQVTVDDQRVLWQTDQGAFLFAALPDPTAQ